MSRPASCISSRSYVLAGADAADGDEQVADVAGVVSARSGGGGAGGKHRHHHDHRQPARPRQGDTPHHLLQQSFLCVGDAHAIRNMCHRLLPCHLDILQQA